MNLQDKMMFYGVSLGKRYSKKERYLFAKAIEDMCKEMNIDFKISEHNTKRYNVENIIAGDLEKAEYVISAPYDTPTASLIKCSYYPFHTKMTLTNEKNDLIVRFVVSAIFFILGGLSLYLRTNIWWIVAAVILVLTGIYFLIPQSNRFNFNRFSASVALASDVLERCEGKKVAVVFCDKVCKGYDGYRLLKNDVKEHQKLIVLDALASGEKLVVAHNGYQENLAELLSKDLNAINKKYDGDKTENNIFAVLGNALFMTSGIIYENDLIVEKTRSSKDIDIDLNRLQKISDTVVKYIKG
ncbi:MAG: DUF2892 domain-containing protein [Erysipelotrichaceae bacterium]|nr:DUF2892 domain-containing protein [Erysipelotrichaceae bacterium]